MSSNTFGGLHFWVWITTTFVPDVQLGKIFWGIWNDLCKNILWKAIFPVFPDYFLCKVLSPFYLKLAAAGCMFSCPCYSSELQGISSIPHFLLFTSPCLHPTSTPDALCSNYPLSGNITFDLQRSNRLMVLMAKNTCFQTPLLLSCCASNLLILFLLLKEWIIY